MNTPAVIPADTLPALIDRATAALECARTSAEVLEARDMARVAYDAAKSAGRIHRAKQAHDSLIAEVHRAQAHALAIRARAEMRLAEEYDAAQERGEVAKPGRGGKNISDGNSFWTPKGSPEYEAYRDKPSPLMGQPAKYAELDFSAKDIHDARRLRDAEAAEPGLVARALDDMLERGEEPTKAALKREVAKPHVAHNTGKVEWYTPAHILDAARAVLGGFDLDPASSMAANEAVRAARIFTAEDDGLAQDWPVGRIWMNPPYASGLVDKFALRFCQAIRDGSSGVVLVNNATETGWFQELLGVADAVCFPKGRVRFVDPEKGESGAPLQGQAIIYCGPQPDAFRAAFCERGTVLCPLR